MLEQKLFSEDMEQKPQGFPAWQSLDFLVIFLKKDPESQEGCRLALSEHCIFYLSENGKEIEITSGVPSCQYSKGFPFKMNSSSASDQVFS